MTPTLGASAVDLHQMPTGQQRMVGAIECRDIALGGKQFAVEVDPIAVADLRDVQPDLIQLAEGVACAEVLKAGDAFEKATSYRSVRPTLATPTMANAAN